MQQAGSSDPYERFQTTRKSESSTSTLFGLPLLGAVVMVVAVLLGLVGLIVGAVALARVRGLTIIPTFSSTYSLALTGLVAENSDFDPVSQRFVFGSIATGSVFSLEPATASASVADGSGIAGVQLAVPSQWISTPSLGTLGVLVDTTGGRYQMWLCRSFFPPVSSGGATLVNMRTGAQTHISFNNLTPATAPLILINDVTVDPNTGTAYFSDTIGGRIISLNANGDPSSANVVFSSALIAPTGPNALGIDGLAFYQSPSTGAKYLIVSEYGSLTPTGTPTTLYRISLSTFAIDAVQLPSGQVIRGADQIRFLNPAQPTTLYITSSVVGPGLPNVYLVQSNDDFVTANVVQRRCAPSPQCKPATPSSIFVQGANVLYTMCNDNFSPTGSTSFVLLDSSYSC